MINIDKYAYTSKLKSIEPIEKFVFSMLPLVVCLYTDKIIISVLIFLIMVSVTVKAGGTPLPVFLKLLLVPMAFIIIGVITIAINISKDSQIFLFSLKVSDSWIGVSKPGLNKAITLFFKVLGSVSCLYFLSLSTPMIDLLTVFRKLKVPKLMIELMGLIYKFIFILIETADTIFIAQNSRLGYINLSIGYRSLGVLISSLFIRAYKRSSDLYNSLEARGYNGELNVLEESFEKNNKLYIGAIVINAFLVIAAVLLR